MKEGYRRRRRRRAAPLEDATDIVLRALDQAGLSDQARRLRIARMWQQAVGSQIASRTLVQSFSRGILLVKAASPTWQNELIFFKEEIIGKLNALLTKGSVRDIRVLSGHIKPLANSRPAADKPARPTASAQHLAAAQSISAPIADEASRAAFERLLVKHWLTERPSDR